jgi:hypothetical protein
MGLFQSLLSDNRPKSGAMGKSFLKIVRSTRKVEAAAGDQTTLLF